MVGENKKITLKSLSVEIANLKVQVSEFNILKQKYANLEKILEILLEEKKHDDKMDNTKLVIENIPMDDKEKCNQCNSRFNGKDKLKAHQKENHTRKRKCDLCDVTFGLNIDLEKHLESHKKPKLFKCDFCDKTFHLKWRLEKHTLGHSSSMKFCHYYNNCIKCPFEENGCMFVHSESPPCKFKEACSNTLCQFRHDKSQSKSQSLHSLHEHSFRHAKSSTPIKENKKKGNCKICRLDITAGMKQYRCDECESDVCETCARKTLIDENWFMCWKCE